ncbi:MAG: hypothetical protein HQL23_04015 [Candidatus Omnitrophica bacterium]|nr:hypothetical protein [Candidatus Omnitrophota bacterium]
MANEVIWPEFTPVRHKRDGYAGWIHSVTRMRELFTGEVDSDWQYTIRVPGKERMLIAPGADLEWVAAGAPFPPYIRVEDQSDGRYHEETRLHSLKYQISDMAWEDRWNLLVYVAVPLIGVGETVHTILSLVHARCKTKKERLERYRYALTEWRSDLDMLLCHYQKSPTLKDAVLLEYIKKTEHKMDDIKIEKKFAERWERAELKNKG